MYAQYQQYQNQNNQYQQPAVTGWASQGGGAQWNGTSWVYPGNNAHHHQQQQQQHQQQQQQKQQVIPPNPIQTFTQYYHGWTKREEELKKQVMNGGTELECQTAENNRKWAKYYAEESSRAAHHFHQYPQATSAPFDLPPAPPTAESLMHNKNDNTNSPLKKSSPRNNAYQNKSMSTMKKPSGKASGSVTRYVRRNIERTEVATDPKLKAFVQSEVEKQIAAAIQKGDLQSRDWDLEPLIVLPFQNAQATASTSSTAAPSNTLGSMKRYVQRNIERPDVAGDPALKSYVQSQLEKKIAVAIQKGNLQSKNWDLEPLIALSSQNATAEPSKQASPQQGYNHYYQRPKQSFEGGTTYNSSRSVSPENRNDGNSSSRGNYYGPAASLSASSTTPNKSRGSESKSSASYYGPASSHNTNSDSDSQYRDNINENNYNAFSSSRSTGKNKNGKRSNHYQQHQNEEDFIPVGYYGPTSSSSPETLNTGNKKSKKWHRKNKGGTETTTTVVTKHNGGMDYSQLTMDKRASRFSGRGGINDAISANYRSSNGMHNSKKNDRFMGKGTIGGSKKKLDEKDFEKMTVKGTSTTLEKEYLRLTAPPRAEFVRPFYILKQHLRNLQSEYYCCRSPEKECDDHSIGTTIQERMKTPQVMWFISDDNKGKECKSEKPARHDYLWFCSQLKAIRQDCTVQRIQGDLAVDVYETHARIALQEGDLNEYNQCQTQLKELYETSPSDSVVQERDISSSIWKHQEEFIAYRLLYYVFLSTNEKYSGGSSDMLNIMLSLTPKERIHPAINHALKVREAVASSDYHGFFRLHKNSPNLGVFLTDLLVPTMRMRGLRRITKAYRPSIELSVCLQQLGFYDDNVEFRNKSIDEKSKSRKVDKDSGKIDEGKSWLISCGGVIEGSKFLTKDSVIHTADTEATKNSLI